MSLNASVTWPRSGITRLTEWGVIRAQGADAATFLHSQLTQDISHLAMGSATLAGYCSAKGRLLATFVVWRQSEDTFALACSADLLPGVLKRLQMFVLRAKCKLSDASADWPLYGVAQPAEAAPTLEGLPGQVWGSHVVAGADVPWQAVRMPDALGHARWLLALSPSTPVPALDDLGADAWRWLEVHSGITRVVAATAEQFVPQMVNLEATAGVSFSKGCYPGQEIVARSQYRGTIKRRAQLFHSSGPLVPGQEVLHSDDASQPAGKVVLAANLGDGQHAAWVEVKTAALQQGQLHMGDALLAPQTQPYALSEGAD